jgi:hypothetical protein
VGVQRYRARELRGADGGQIFKDKQPDDIVTLYRPPEEILDEESVASFEDMPITDGHPDPSAYPNGVTADNWKRLAIGHVRDCKGNTKDGCVEGRVRIYDAAGVHNVLAGRSQVSMGYGFDCETKPGIHSDGQAYDGIMRKVRGNHLAIVDVARGGPGCRIADNQPSEDTMATTVKITIDGYDHEVPEGNTATLVRNLLGARDGAVKELADKTAAHTTAVTKMATDHAAEIKALKDGTIPKTEIDKLVAERVALLGDAAQLCPALKVDGLSSLAIRRAVAEELVKQNTAAKSVADALLAGVALDKATDDQVIQVSSAVIASVKSSTADGAARRNDIARAFAAPGGAPNANQQQRSEAADGEVEDLSDETYQRNHFQAKAGKK